MSCKDCTNSLAAFGFRGYATSARGPNLSQNLRLFGYASLSKHVSIPWHEA